MTEELKIGGIPASAPLWRNTPPETLVRIVKCLSDASFHYADDSGREWGRARELVVEAAALANAHSLDFVAMRYLHEDKPQLVSLNTFVNTVLQELRAK